MGSGRPGEQASETRRPLAASTSRLCRIGLAVGAERANERAIVQVHHHYLIHWADSMVSLYL
jgi:hypothetical protein